MADIFKEVDEELRRDNLAKLWSKYGRSLISVAAGIVLAVAAVQAWRAYDLNRRSDLSDRYAAALDVAAGGDPTAALNALAELSEAGSGSYAGLAAFEEARLRLESGDRDGAVKIWDKLAAESALGEGFRSIATLLSVMHQLDTADSAVLRSRLDPLATDGQPFRSSAREMLALLALLDGDRATARELYTGIADDREAPAGLRARAAQMLQTLKD